MDNLNKHLSTKSDLSPAEAAQMAADAIHRNKVHMERQAKLDAAAATIEPKEVTGASIVASWDDERFSFESTGINGESGQYENQVIDADGLPVAIKRGDGSYKFETKMADSFPDAIDWTEKETIEALVAYFNRLLSLQLDGSGGGQEKPDTNSHADFVDKSLLALAEICERLALENQDKNQFGNRFVVFNNLKIGQKTGNFGVQFFGRALYLYSQQFNPKTQEIFWKRHNLTQGSNNQIGWRTDDNIWRWSDLVSEWITYVSLDRKTGLHRTLEDLTQTMSKYLIWNIYTFTSEEFGA